MLAARAAQRRIGRVDARQLVARAVELPHRQHHRLHAAVLQPAQDLRVALGHRLGHCGTELAGQQLARVGLLRYRFDRTVQRGAEQLGAQRVAVFVGAAGLQQRTHVGGQLAQLGVAGVRYLLADAVGVHPFFDRVVVDQAEGLPIGSSERAFAIFTRRQLVLNAPRELVGEHLVKHADVAAQIELSRDHQIALGDPAARLRHQAEAFRHAAGHRRQRGPDQVDCRVERGSQEGVGSGHLETIGPLSPALWPVCQLSVSRSRMNLKMRPKTGANRPVACPAIATPGVTSSLRRGFRAAAPRLRARPQPQA